MREIQVDGRTISVYLATPERGGGPSVLVLHPWWGLTEPFQRVCDRLADAGFVALAPDLYHGKTATTIEEAEALGAELDRDEGRWRGDIMGSVQFLRQHGTSDRAMARNKLALVGFSLGGAYGLDVSVKLADEIAAVVTFYASYSDLDYHRAQAAYLCHFAEDDPFEPADAATGMERALQSAGRPFTIYTYPGTRHWFFEENRPEYNAEAAQLSWERTIAFLHQQLD